MKQKVNSTNEIKDEKYKKTREEDFFKSVNWKTLPLVFQ